MSESIHVGNVGRSLICGRENLQKVVCALALGCQHSSLTSIWIIGCDSVSYFIIDHRLLGVIVLVISLLTTDLPLFIINKT